MYENTKEKTKYTKEKLEIYGNFKKEKTMCKFIKIEYVVANALCELFDSKKQTTINFDVLKEYGVQVEKVFSKNNDTKAIFLFSNEYKKEFLRDYSELFDATEESIFLKEGKTTEDIRARILDYVSLDLLLALFDCSSLAKLA